MTTPKIVDAVSTAPVAAPTTTVPVKIDGSALASVLSKIAASQPQQPSVEYISPAEYVLNAGKRLQDMYARYEVLRKLGGLLNGKPLNDPVPPELVIEDVTIRFRLRDAEEVSEAKVLNVACVGDIARLLSTEMGTIILTLQQEAKSLTELSQKTEATAQKAREAWESGNKDRKIVAASDASGAAATVSLANTADVAPASEVSLANEN